MWTGVSRWDISITVIGGLEIEGDGLWFLVVLGLCLCGTWIEARSGVEWSNDGRA